MKKKEREEIRRKWERYVIYCLVYLKFEYCLMVGRENKIIRFCGLMGKESLVVR